MEQDIRKIFADKIVVVDNHVNEMMKSELVEQRQIIENLKALGIEYVECPICDSKFSSNADKNNHLQKSHTCT